MLKSADLQDFGQWCVRTFIHEAYGEFWNSYDWKTLVVAEGVILKVMQPMVHFKFRFPSAAVQCCTHNSMGVSIVLQCDDLTSSPAQANASWCLVCVLCRVATANSQEREHQHPSSLPHGTAAAMWHCATFRIGPSQPIHNTRQPFCLLPQHNVCASISSFLLWRCIVLWT